MNKFSELYSTYLVKYGNDDEKIDKIDYVFDNAVIYSLLFLLAEKNIITPEESKNLFSPDRLAYITDLLLKELLTGDKKDDKFDNE